MANYYQNPLSGTAPPNPNAAPTTTPAATKPLKRALTHKCPYPNCDRWLSCPHNVRQHIREAHTGEKPYACEQCGRAFTRPWSLYRHLAMVHQLEDAGPGRGRGGGLERIGVERPRGMRRGGKVGPRAEGGGGGGGAYATQQQQQQQQQLPARPVAKGRNDDFEIDNFTPKPTACVCGAQFENREAFLAHVHLNHGEPNSADCNCMSCLSIFDGPVDGAGVHVYERDAVMMRELMADDLFGQPSGSKGQMMGVAPAVTPADQGRRDRAVPGADQGQFKYGLEMSVEEFTKNMRPAGKPPALNPSLTASTLRHDAPLQDASFTASPAMQSEGGEEPIIDEPNPADWDDLDAWLKSAQDVFGDVGEVGMSSGSEDAMMG